jgi:hypothetical protein
MVTFNSLHLPNYFQRRCPIYIPASLEFLLEIPFLHIFINTYDFSFLFFIMAILDGVKWYLIVFSFAFPSDKSCCISFQMLVCHLQVFFEKYLFNFFAHSSIQLFFFLLCKWRVNLKDAKKDTCLGYDKLAEWNG